MKATDIRTRFGEYTPLALKIVTKESICVRKLYKKYKNKIHPDMLCHLLMTAAWSESVWAIALQASDEKSKLISKIIKTKKGRRYFSKVLMKRSRKRHYESKAKKMGKKNNRKRRRRSKR